MLFNKEGKPIGRFIGDGIQDTICRVDLSEGVSLLLDNGSYVKIMHKRDLFVSSKKEFASYGVFVKEV